MEKNTENIRIIARNRKARHDYSVEQTYEAGIELKGSEVKSLREGKINISDAYATVEKGEIILKNLHISPYKMSAEQIDPIRNRRLLLHKREIRKVTIKIEQRGMTLIPLQIYFKGPYLKIELGLAVGRKKHDKRQSIAKEDANRRIRQALRKDTGS